MTLTLYAHPLSSYSQKVLVALWENGIGFAYRHLGEDGAHDEMRALWPTGRFPVLVDGDTVLAESSIIIEHLQIRHPGPVRLIPDDPAAALSADARELRTRSDQLRRSAGAFAATLRASALAAGPAEPAPRLAANG